MMGPATHPIVLMAHARERIPDPMTAVMMCAPAVNQLPVEHACALVQHLRLQQQQQTCIAHWSAWREELQC